MPDNPSNHDQIQQATVDALVRLLGLPHDIDDGPWGDEDVPQEIAAAFAKLRRFDKALETARSIKTEWRRVDALNQTAVALARSNDSRASAVFSEVLGIARGIDDDNDRCEILCSIVTALAQARQFNQALQLVPDLDDRRIDGLVTIGVALAEANDARADNIFSQALEIARNTEDDYSLKDVAVACANTGRFNQAGEAVRSMEETSYQRHWVVDALARAGQFGQALEIARSMNDVDTQIQTLNSIAVALSRVGDSRAQAILSDALELARRVNDAEDRSRYLFEIAKAMVSAHDGRVNAICDEALQVAHRIEDPATRVSQLSDLAGVMAQAGDTRAQNTVAEALNTVRSLTDAYKRNKALEFMPAAFARIGQVNQALDLASQFKEGFDRDDALSHVASELIGLRQFRQAFDILPHIGNPDTRGQCQRQLIKALVEMKQFGQALGIARTIGHVGHQAAALHTIATFLAPK
jgi:tetratricopeptide (TPR) repeat protein